LEVSSEPPKVEEVKEALKGLKMVDVSVQIYYILNTLNIIIQTDFWFIWCL